jgi:hypothetical protein
MSGGPVHVANSLTIAGTLDSNITKVNGVAVSASNPLPTSLSELPTNNSVFRDEFEGSVLDTAKWQLIQTGTGMDVSFLNSTMRVKTGVTAASETIIRSVNKYSFESLFKFAVLKNLHQAEQEVIVEVIDNPPTLIANADWSKVTNGVLNFTSVSGSNVITINSGTPVVGAYVAGTNIAASSYIMAVDGALAILNNNCSGSATNNTTSHLSLQIDTAAPHGLSRFNFIEVTASSDATMLGYNTTTIATTFLVTNVASATQFSIIPNNGTFAGGAGPGTLSFYPITNQNIMRFTQDNTSATSGRFQVWSNGLTYTVSLNATPVITVSTLVNPGIIGMMRCNDGIAWFADLTNNSTSGMTVRAARENRVPMGSTQGYIQIRIKNIGVPAASQYIDFDFVRALIMDEIPVFISGRGMAQNAKEAVSVSVAAIPTVTANSTLVAPSTSANGITSTGLINSANTANLTSLKGSAGTVVHISLTNHGSTHAYFKLYNKASAPATASDTPIMVIGLPPGAVYSPPLVFGHRFTTGIAYSIVGGPVNTDAIFVQANQITGFIEYV